MPARATQPAGVPAGQAQVQVIGAGEIDVGTLEICVSGIQDAVEKHLDPRLTGDAWTTAYVWFHPGNPRIEGPALLFDLAPSVTWHLRPHAPYVLRLRDGKGLKREERLTWIAIRLPSQAPQGYVPPKGPAPRPEAKPVPQAAPVVDAGAALSAEAERAIAEREAAEREAAAAADRRREDEERRRRVEDEKRKREAEEGARLAAAAGGEGERKGVSKALLGGIAAAVLLAAGGTYLMKDQLFGPSAPPQVATPVIPTTLDGARTFLAGNPGADESFGLAEKFKAAKALDGAFLLLRASAGKGSAPAALALGEMYDPATYTPETSPLPAPNPAQAAEWYKQAAQAGMARAQYRLGMLLMSGKTDEPNGPELGASWLRKAADQGLPEAKEALPK